MANDALTAASALGNGDSYLRVSAALAIVAAAKRTELPPTANTIAATRAYRRSWGLMEQLQRGAALDWARNVILPMLVGRTEVWAIADALIAPKVGIQALAPEAEQAVLEALTPIISELWDEIAVETEQRGAYR